MNDSDLKQFDDVIIGSGQAAPSLAVTLGSHGRNVALVEGNALGGSCVNYGCTPTKTLRKSARVAHMVRNAGSFGVDVPCFTVNFAAAMARMRDRVSTSRGGLEQWLASSKGVTPIWGWASFDGRDGDRFKIRIGDRAITAGRVFLNTGTRPFIPSIPGLAESGYLDNVTLLDLSELPRHLIVLGGSYIGLEMGQIFRRLGSDVTIIEAGPDVASREDNDVSEAVRNFLDAEGIRILRNSAVVKIQRTGASRIVELGNGDRIEGSHILIATGRLPNTDRIALESVGVETDERGYVPTDDHLRTNVHGIWALGDINKRGAFTHTSYHDHEIVLASISGAASSKVALYQWKSAAERPQTYAMFTDPPLGRVGMGLREAKAAANSGRRILVATHQMAQISRAKEESETFGLIRLVVDADTDKFLGATVLGFNGDEIIAIISNFMASGSSYRIMQQALPVHPTVAEFLPTILAKLEPVHAQCMQENA
ncbi:MAG: mercuric reductase [Hyphomicrobium sp.]|nr:mercuric reductase [Hyphomicrobium sp.]